MKGTLKQTKNNIKDQGSLERNLLFYLSLIEEVRLWYPTIMAPLHLHHNKAHMETLSFEFKSPRNRERMKLTFQLVPRSKPHLVRQGLSPKSNKLINHVHVIHNINELRILL